MIPFRIAFLCGMILIGGVRTGVAQIDNLPIIPSINMPISPQALGVREPTQMPNREELRMLGLSEEEIDIIFDNMELLEGGNSLDTYSQGQDLLREPTPIQGDGGSSSGTAVDTASAPVDMLAAPDKSPDFSKLEEKVYGHRYFRTISEFRNATGDRAPDSYVLKPGDEITITAYGRVDFQGIYTVSEDGYIFQKEAGRVYVKGLELGNAKVLLQNRFGRFINLSGSKFDVAITYSPVIRVNIVGEVANPGTYTISSWNSAFNAIAVANGPTDLGSVRRIELRREGKTIKILDLYRFLMDPASNQDFFLQENDYLVIPPYRKTVTVSGQVRRPHTYEMLDDEHMNKLLEFSGGVTSNAYTSRVQVQRFTGSQRIIRDVNLDSLKVFGGDFLLYDGDYIRIDTVSDEFENYVEVRGDVNFPGRFELRPGYRIYDVLEKAQGNAKYDKIDQAYLIRLDDDFNPRYIPISIGNILQNRNAEDNVLLEERDIIEVIGKQFLVEGYTVSIDGAVKNPGSFTYAKGMTLKDLLFYSGGPRTEAAVDRIEVSRIVSYDASADEFRPSGGTKLETVAIGFDLKSDKAAEEYLLQPYDEIFVHTAEGFRLPQKVKIAGEVRFPGTYTLENSSVTVMDLIERAGGFTDAAFAEGATMYRRTNTGINAADNPEGSGDQRRMVLELEKASKKPESHYNHVLQPGDMVTIPKTMDYVRLSGLMASPEIDTAVAVSVPYESGKRAKYYINNYGGGFDQRAKKNRTLVMEPNGKVRRTKEIFWINIYPKVTTEGAEVIAIETHKPEVRYAREYEKKPFDWNIFIASTSAGILSFATIYALILRSSN